MSRRGDSPRYNHPMRGPPTKIETPDDRVVEILRSMTPAERLAIGLGMWSSASRMLRCLLSQQHPEWDEDRISRELARRDCPMDLSELLERVARTPEGLSIPYLVTG